jgi:hypothetical protein
MLGIYSWLEIPKLHCAGGLEPEHDIERWGRGSVWIKPSAAQCQALGIRI